MPKDEEFTSDDLERHRARTGQRAAAGEANSGDDTAEQQQSSVDISAQRPSVMASGSKPDYAVYQDLHHPSDQPGVRQYLLHPFAIDVPV